MDDVQDLQGVLCALADKIREADRRIAGLCELMAQLEEEPASFTDSEREATRRHIDAEADGRNRMLAALRAKVEVYESRVVELHERLGARKRILDSNPQSLEAAPELLSVFVEQHAAIAAELQSARDFLLAA